MSGPLRIALVVALLVAHLLAMAGVWPEVRRSTHGRDYASYHYAAAEALAGGDPYDRAALSRRAREEGTRRRVYPFLYPPPFLLAVAWSPGLPLPVAYRVWFGVNVLSALVVALALARGLAPLGPPAGLLVCGALALCTAVPNNALMGQANLPVLALALLGLWAEDRGRGVLGGVLLGLAVLLKLSPVLLLGWWILRGRWRAVAAAGVTGLVGLGVAWGVLGPGPLWGFLVEVLPTLRSGGYNELGLPVSLFGNHGLPNLWHQLLPSGGNLLGPAAQVGSAATAVALLAGVGWALRPSPVDPLSRWAQPAAILVLTLLLPAFTYEHHLVLALPAVVVSLHALATGRLSVLWALPVGLAAAAWAADLATLKTLASGAPDIIAWLVQESKTAALLVLLLTTVRLGRAP